MCVLIQKHAINVLRIMVSIWEKQLALFAPISIFLTLMDYVLNAKQFRIARIIPINVNNIYLYLI
jgi:hypothetical protein